MSVQISETLISILLDLYTQKWIDDI
jgi:hypothetical protein